MTKIENKMMRAVLVAVALLAVSLVHLSSGAPEPACCFPRHFVSSYEHFADQGGFQVPASKSLYILLPSLLHLLHLRFSFSLPQPR
jgi:hypothetical protein